MSSDRLEQLETLYNEALALPPADRPAFLDRVCGGDTGLRRELTSLLGYEHEAESYLDTPAIQVVAGAMAENGAGLLIDRRLGRYQLLSLVGRGGMGEVYCAVDTRLNRLVAVKLLPSYLAADPERRYRFEQEARAVAALNHPHICTLHDIGNDEQMHYLVFEYLAGELLSDRLSRGSLETTEALGYAIQIGDALVHAHEHGILHLDLKPQNIMLTRSGAKLFDFGIAELRDGVHPSGDLAATGGRPLHAGAGTPGYLAPEQREGRPTDGRTDVFSFGAVMYEIFTGRAAFPVSHPGAEAAPILEMPSEAPAALSALIARCLATSPADRWVSMADLSLQLRKINAGG
jgi:serine/threonine protein kinase